MKTEPLKIISGGQTGVDRAALEVALQLEITTGGTAPFQFMTEKGPDLTLKEFGLVECKSKAKGYRARTYKNAEDSDVTLFFGVESPGHRTTQTACRVYNKPFLHYSLDYFQNANEEVIISLLEEIVPNYFPCKNLILNIAGNRESVSPGISQKIKPILFLLLKNLKRLYF